MSGLIKYLGGKNGMANQIIEEFPEKGSYDTYIEPFGGSFGVGFRIPDELIAPIEIYNDLEMNVYSLFKVLSDEEKFRQFKTLCDCSYYNEQFRAEYREELKNNKNIPDVNRAFMFFYVNRTSHNGIGGFSMQKVIRRNMSKNVSDFLSAIDGLYEVHQRLSHVTILNRDGIQLMKDNSAENVFIYADPPYVQSTRGNTRYTIDMNDEIQRQSLSACIDSKAKILISGYDCEEYNVLLDNGFTKTSFETNNRTESLWRNY